MLHSFNERYMYCCYYYYLKQLYIMPIVWLTPGNSCRTDHRKKSGLFAGHEPTRGSSHGVFKMSRVGSGRVGSGRVGSGRVGSEKQV